MQRNVRLLLAYDGTDFHGWQRQPELRTVQSVVEQAVRRVARHQIVLNGSGRTDAGVHARGQVANFETDCPLACEALLRAIGSRLPKDVALYHVRDVPIGFRCSLHAVAKLYRYRIHNRHHRPVEQLTQRQVYHFWHPLDLDRMRAGARHFVGEHDFAAVASKGRGTPRQTTVRTVLGVGVFRHGDELRVDVEGTGFLYNQVRNMVGTLIEVGRGRWAPDRVRDILASRERASAGPTAPARGLCLQWVHYDPADLGGPAFARSDGVAPGPPSDARPNGEKARD